MKKVNKSMKFNAIRKEPASRQSIFASRYERKKTLIYQDAYLCRLCDEVLKSFTTIYCYYFTSKSVNFIISSGKVAK